MQREGAEGTLVSVQGNALIERTQESTQQRQLTQRTKRKDSSDVMSALLLRPLRALREMKTRPKAWFILHKSYAVFIAYCQKLHAY